ncbi:MAG: TonB-dependent receptor [Thermoanaerobaculia bacterium]|nr:TonB-dependent receptor [Thermoanaerobaculia bacterium]
MKTFLLVLTGMIMLGASVAAQKIGGQIHQSDGAPAEFATVLLYNAADTTLVKGSVSNPQGEYEFENVAPGRYFINTELVGAGKGATAAFDYNGGDKTLEAIVLQEKTQELGTVTIVARRPVIEVQADKTVLNVEGNVNSQGQNALELLRKAPGVVVDNNDRISLRGKNAVRFQIDGRDVRMDGKDLADILKGMRAEDITAIEMITNPSAKFDASGNAGIINIKTRKIRTDGTNGSIGGEAIFGKTLKGGGNLSFNHRNKRMNVFGNYSNHFGNWKNELYLRREQAGKVFDQASFMDDNNNNHNFKLGTDFFLNSRHTIGFVADGRHAQGPWENDARTDIYSLDAPNQLDSVLVASNRVPQNRNNFNFNLNYRFADTSGHELTLDANRGIYRYRADSYQPNFYKDPTEQNTLSQKIYRNNTPTDIGIWMVKADYEQRLFKGKLGVGVKFSQVETDNTFDFFNVIDETPVPDINRSNRFVYAELVSAAYVNYNIQVKKWGFQAGLRAEHTDWQGNLTSLKPNGNESNGDKYLSWFPSAALTWNMNEKNQFGLTYSRRIDRPNYRDLNPFEDRLDELAYKKGNPFLRPQFTNNLELTHTFMGMLNTTIGYSHTNDMFTEVIDTTETDRTFLTNDNVAVQDNFSISIGAPIPIAKWWQAYVSVTGFIASYEANFREGFMINETFKAINLYSEHTFHLPKGWSLQLSGWYNSPSIWGAVFRSKAQGAMDFGIKKQFMEGKATASLSFGDILGTAGWSSVNDFTPGLYMAGHGNWESRTVRCNLSYRFGNNNIKGAQQRRTGIEDINKRIGK